MQDGVYERFDAGRQVRRQTQKFRQEAQSSQRLGAETVKGKEGPLTREGNDWAAFLIGCERWRNLGVKYSSKARKAI